MTQKVALITGAAKRIGAVIAQHLHNAGMNIVIHYHHSKPEADLLCSQFNNLRSNSAHAVSGDIASTDDCQRIISEAQAQWGRLDALINNASSFYPTRVGETNETQWHDLIGSNLKGPFFLSQAAKPFLLESQGNIINITDIHGDRPLKRYPVYSLAKAGLIMLTKSLARELGPHIRVNAVSPGVILWPNEENAVSDSVQDYIVNRTCLKRKGSPEDIAETVHFLLNQGYITGQTIAVDGGRSVRD
jgi:pteridine reductase